MRQEVVLSAERNVRVRNSVHSESSSESPSVNTDTERVRDDAARLLGGFACSLSFLLGGFACSVSFLLGGFACSLSFLRGGEVSSATSLRMRLSGLSQKYLTGELTTALT